MTGSFFSIVETYAAARPAHPLIIDPSGASISYGAMLARTAQYAHLLMRLGARPGDRVLVKAEKSADIVLLYLACLRAGLAFLPVNPGFKSAETAHIVADAEPAIIVCAPAEETAMRATAPASTRAILTLGETGGGTLRSMAAEEPLDFATVAAGPETLAVILYTSGTTGRPKGAMLSHGNIAANAVALSAWWAFTRDDVLLHCLPLFHSHGLFVSLSCTLASGSSLILCPKFDLDETLDLMPRATVFMGVPTMYVRLAVSPRLDRERCDGIRLFASGSAALLPDTFAAFARRTGQTIVERYGMTETAVNTSNPLEGARKPGSVGLPLACTQVRITGEDGAELARDTPGAVCVRGPHVFGGYWRNPTQSAEVLAHDGWFDTGDIGRVDADGYLTLVGRAKDMIISGGYNVYPLEVEGVIDQLDGVVESTVIGLPHPDFGEAVTAVIAAQQDHGLSEAAVSGFVKERLANYKAPKRVIFLDALPRNDIGKVQKSVLRERYMALYQAG